jgi:hypothetical protein
MAFFAIGFYVLSDVISDPVAWAINDGWLCSHGRRLTSFWQIVELELIGVGILTLK